MSWAFLGNVSLCKTNTPFVGLGIIGAIANWNTTDVDAVVPPLASLAAYTVGASGNNDGCRIYHLTVASTNVTHCPHGDVFGGGVCGVIPNVFCTIFTRACGTTSTLGTQANCETASAAFLARMGTPGDQTGDTFSCRAYHAATALGMKTQGMANNASCSNAIGTTICVGGPPAKSSASSIAAGAVFALVSLLM